MVFVFTFGCGTTILANTLLDQSEPEFYKAKIINKEIEKGKSTFYRINVEPWGPILESKLMRVSKEEFDRIKVNDSIELELRNGFFKTQWIKIK